MHHFRVLLFLNTMEEIWKDVPNYIGIYKASNLGRIKSFHKGYEVILKGSLSLNNYYMINLCKNKKQKKLRVHQIIAMTFLGHIPNKFSQVVNHINFDKLDNRLDNLEIITHRENTNKKHIKSTSKFVGVSFCSYRKKYMATIIIKGDSVFLLRTIDEIKACNAYKLALENINLYKGDKNKFRELIKIKLKTYS